MSNEEKFILEAKVENTVRENNNQNENIETEPSSLEEVFIPKELVEADDEKKLAEAREDFKKMNSTAEILSATSTPSSERDKSHETFLEFVFPKLGKFSKIVKEDRRLEEEEKQKRMADGIPEEKQDLSFKEMKKQVGESLKEETGGIKKFFKKLFS